MRQLSSPGIRARAKTAISAALFAGAAGAAPVFAQEGGPLTEDPQQAVTTVESITAVGRQEVESPKYTAPLLETPQTITVVPKEVIEAQNLMSLRDILSTLPGITFGAGEGGGGFGDSINLRGYSANNDITVDGVRDTAQYTRSDPFNLEQVEVTNGANSVYAGSGSVGGSINLVSKAPRAGNQTIGSAGIGTDGYYRATLDANRELTPSIAGRLNLMAHANDAPDREVETFRRWGIAPSITFGVGSMTQLNLSLFHQTDDNVPQYGVPYASNSIVNGPLPGVDRSQYFGFRNMDRQESDASSATIRLDHDFGNDIRVRNLTRYQLVSQDLVVNPPQGTFCLASGINPQNGLACTNPPNSYQPSGPRGNLRLTENTLLHNQTDLTAEFETGGVRHTINAGLSFTSESFDLDSGNVQRTTTGATPIYAVTSLSDPDTLYTGPMNTFVTSRQYGERDNQSVYLFDHLEVSETFSLNGGLRFEHNEGSNRTDAISAAGVVTPGPNRENEDDLLSFRLGAVYMPIANASIYVAYGNSRTPSQVSVSGGCSDTNCNVDPEEAENLEIGAKWDLARGLSLTAAVFRNERNQFRVPSAVVGLDEVLDGRSRVDGVSLGAAGLIRENWAVYANYTYLKSELLQGVADANQAIDFRAGDPLPNTPEHAFSIWSTWDVTPRWQVGYGVTYSGEYAYNRSGTTVTSGTPPLTRAVFAPLFYAPDYFVHALAVTWRFDNRTELRLNVRNVTDEEYYTRIRSAGAPLVGAVPNQTTPGGFGWATPGEARNATLTLTRRF